MAYQPHIADPNTVFGERLVGQLTPLWQYNFEYTVDNTDLLEKTVTSGGTVTQSQAMCVVGTSTTTGSTARIRSDRHATYHAGLGSHYRFTAMFTSPVAGTWQLAGLAGDAGSTEPFKEGFMIGYEGTTMSIHLFRNDVGSTINQSAWDDPLDGTGDSGMTIDWTKLNVFVLRFEYLGAGKMELWVEDNDTGNFVKVHTIHKTNRNTEPNFFDPNFHGTYYADNGATSSNMVVKGASMAFFIEGKAKLSEVQQPVHSSGLIEKTTVTTEIPILTLRVKSTYGSKTNNIEIELLDIAASIEAGAANNLGGVRLIKNGTLGGTAASWSDINTNNSVVEVDTSSTTVSGGTELMNVPLAGKNDKENRDISRWQEILHKGDTITIAGSSANSATIDAVLLFKELF